MIDNFPDKADAVQAERCVDVHTGPFTYQMVYGSCMPYIYGVYMTPAQMLKLEIVQERAESMERVLAVDILHLLAAEGIYGAQVTEQLNASDVWHAYRDQKHDLFLPAGGTAQVTPQSPLTMMHAFQHVA